MAQDQEMKSIWVRLPPALIDKLDEAAKLERRRSRAAQIQYMLERDLAANYVDESGEEE
jgi:metal-responsive CopG/Arc/MetJ family transcriptional regulator